MYRTLNQVHEELANKTSLLTLNKAQGKLMNKIFLLSKPLKQTQGEKMPKDLLNKIIKFTTNSKLITPFLFNSKSIFFNLPLKEFQYQSIDFLSLIFT